MCWLLGISPIHNRAAQTVSLSQTSYIKTITQCFYLENTHDVWMPMEHKLPLSHPQSPNSIEKVEEMAAIPYCGAVVSAMYASLCMRPDITFAVHKLAQYSINPGMVYWLAIQQVLQYLWTMQHHVLVLGGGVQAPQLLGWTDSDFGSCVDSCKSMSGYVFSICK